MNNRFFEQPILNSPYEYPPRHWELDSSGQPTQQIIEKRRRAEFITPIPKPKKRRAAEQQGFVFDDGKGLSTQDQQYDPTSIINALRIQVEPAPQSKKLESRSRFLTKKLKQQLVRYQSAPCISPKVWSSAQ